MYHPTHRVIQPLLHRLRSEGYFICTIPHTGYHSPCYTDYGVRDILYVPSHIQGNTALVTPITEHRLEREIAQYVYYYTMSGRSTTELHLAP